MNSPTSLIFLLLLTLAGCCSPPERKLVAVIELKRSKVMEMISLGMAITEAQQILRDADFVLAYQEPIFPTNLRNYQQQLVLLAPFDPSISETFRYTTGMSPCPNQFQAFVVIEADVSGKITKIR